VGSDRDPERLEDTLENLAGAGFEGARNLELRQADVADLELRPGWNALLATNPPYGERLGDLNELRAVYRGLGRRLRAEAAGYRVALLTGNPELAAELALPELGSLALLNGAIECQLLHGLVAEPG
jgi:23S rRNA G2445 N2-methylase RlmL